MSYEYRYRLAPSLGGGEYPGRENSGHVLLDTPDGVLPVPREFVTKIIPEEPEEGSFVTVLREGNLPLVFMRGEREQDERWWSYLDLCWVTWERVYTLGVPRLLTYGGKIVRGGAARGFCGHCKQTRPVRVDGKLKLHGAGYDRCPGSQRYPEETIKR